MRDYLGMNRHRESEQSPVMTAREASEYSGLASERTFVRWAKSGQIRHIALPNGQVRFRRSDLDALMTPVVASASSADDVSSHLFDRVAGE